MGKSGKLRRIFGISRRKASSPTLDKKLSLPKLLEKGPAPPNQYFRDGKEHDYEMAQDKLDPSVGEDCTKLPKRKNQEKSGESLGDVIKYATDADDASHGDMVDLDIAPHKISPPDMNDNVVTKGRSFADGACGEAMDNREHANNDDVQMHSLPVDDVQFSPVPNENENPRKYRKEFPTNRNKPLLQDAPEQDMQELHEADAQNGFAMTSTGWNASGECRVTASSLLPAASSSSFSPTDCSCSQCRPPSGPVKECDWGWFTNISTPPSSSGWGAQQPSTSGVMSCSFKVSSFPVNKNMQRSYVNEEQSPPVFHFGAGTPSIVMTASHPASSTECHPPDITSEITFTITESNGRVLQFSVVNPEMRQLCESRPPLHCDDSTTVTSSTPQPRSFSVSPHDQMKIGYGERTASWKKFGGEDSFGRISSSTFDSCRRSDGTTHLKGCFKMTPNLSSRNRESKGNQQMAVSKDRVRKNGDILQSGAYNEAPHSRGHRAKPKSSPHFELSMASYSKLIAYCDTNKLLIQNSTQSSTGERSGSSSHERTAQRDSLLSDPTTSTATANNTGKVNDLCRLARVLETVEECSWYWGAMSGQDSRKILRDSAPGTFLLRDSSDPRYLFSLSVKTRQGPTSIRIVYTDGAFRFDSEMDDVNSRRQGGRQQGRDGSSRHGAGHPNYVKRLTPIFTCVINMVLFYTNHLGLVKPRTRKAVSSSGESNEEVKSECERCSSSTQLNTTKAKSPERMTGSAPASSHPTGPKGSSDRPEQFMCYWVNRSGRQEIPVVLNTPKTQGFPSLQRLCRQTLSASQKLWVNKDKIEQFPLPNSLKKYIKKYPYPI